MSHKIEIERSDRIDGIKVITWISPMECSVTHMTWEDFDALVAGAEKLRQPEPEPTVAGIEGDDGTVSYWEV